MLTILSAPKLGLISTYPCKEEYIGNENKVKQFSAHFYDVFTGTKKAKNYLAF